MRPAVRLLGAALALGVGAGGLWILRAPPPAAAATPQLDALAAWREAVKRGQLELATLLAGRRWDEAAAAARELAELDPLSPEAAEALRRAPEERAVEVRVEEARGAAELGRHAEALEALLGVPTGSAYEPLVRADVQALAARVAASHRGACLGSSPRDPASREACRRALALTCHVRPDAELERRAGAGWSCPPELARWFGGGDGAGAALIAVVRRTYGEGEVAEAVLQHAALGRTRAALERLGGIRGDPRAPALAEQLQRLDARLQDGRAALLSGRLREADAAWGEAFATDARVVPGVGAVTVIAARRELARAWAEEARRLLQQGQLRAAASAVESGLAAEAGGVELRELRERVAREAAERLAQAPCGELRELEALVPAGSRADLEARLAACR